ncbi:hypothetical protein E4U52_006188 [Claviceps spartinae]|nr:hypothetical protein E4U52_006188 [Claviceps spartinae]
MLTGVFNPGAGLSYKSSNQHRYVTTEPCGMPDDDPLKILYEKLENRYGYFGSKSKFPLNLESYLSQAGFETIHCQIMKLPIGPWAKDRTMRIVGQYQKNGRRGTSTVQQVTV